MGTKNNPGRYDCYEKAEPDEPMFILLARDPLAANLVRMWASLHRSTKGANLEKVEEAYANAAAMDHWRKQRGE
jgi:hypothetical protein